MEKTMATLHYSATRQREIAAIRDKYAVYQGKKAREASESGAQMKAAAAGITVGTLATAMAVQGIVVVNAGIVPLGLAMCAAGVAGIYAAKPVYYMTLDSSGEKDR